MNNLKGAAKIGLILVSILVAVLGVSVLVSYINSVSMGEGFVVSNITAGGQTNLFAATNAGLNFTAFESGATNVTVNVSIKAFYGNVTRVNITVPGFFNLSSEFSNITSNTSNANQSNIMFRNFSYGASGITNISWTANSANDGNGKILNSSTTGYFSFRLNVPAGITIPTNNSANITITLEDQVAGTANSTNITLYINDTVLPNAVRYTGATRANNTNVSNTTDDFNINFNETNPVFVNLSVGFGNNKTAVNKSMTISSGGSSATAQLSVAGLPDGNHNFTVFVTDVQNTQTSNGTYFITTDTTGPVLSLTLPSGTVTKSATLSSSDLSCSATDATSGFASTSFSISIAKPTGTTVNLGCGNSFSDTADIGEYTVTFTANDQAGNSNSKTGTFKVGYAQNTATTTTSSASTPSSSSAVLATATLTVTAPVTSAKPVDLPVPADVAAKASVSKIQVEVTKDVAAADATVEIKALDKIPVIDDKNQSLTALPSDQQPVLKVIQIKPSAALSTAISKATVSFTLTNIDLAGRDPSKIILTRFADGKWNDLPTTAGSAKADGSVDFTAITPGFSVFVVTTKAPEPIVTPQATTVPAGTGKTPTATTAPTAPAQPLSTTLLFGIVAVIVIIVIVVVVLMKRKQ